MSHVQLTAGEAPGLGVVQATHLVSSTLFCTRHVSHVQLPAGGAKPDRGVIDESVADDWCGFCDLGSLERGGVCLAATLGS